MMKMIELAGNNELLKQGVGTCPDMKENRFFASGEIKKYSHSGIPFYYLYYFMAIVLSVFTPIRNML